VTEADVIQAAASDDDAADFLTSIEPMPTIERAIRVIHELCTSASASWLS
jgi:hypothetical protein